MRDTLLYLKFAVQYALENKTLSHIKHFRRWYRDMHSGTGTLSLKLPWITYDAIDFLSKICTLEMTVFEWGSGGSTLFFARHCRHVTSVEHNIEWKNLLLDKLSELSITNVDYKAIAGEKIADWHQKKYQNPDDFVSKDPQSEGLSFEKYVKAIDTFPHNHFDLIVVDGRARNCCVKRAIPHLKKNGYLVVDNSDRKYYLAGFPELNDPSRWQKTEFEGPVFFQHSFAKTSFFRKL